LVQIFDALGSLYIDGKLDIAAEFAQKAVDLSREIYGESFQSSERLFNRGWISFLSGKHLEAQRHLESALDITERCATPRHYRNTLREKLAEFFEDCLDYRRAREILLREGDEVIVDYGDFSWNAMVRAIAGTYSVMVEDWEEALAHSKYVFGRS
jgi:tetratricopeptide (TPR) repeat protein